MEKVELQPVRTFSHKRRAELLQKLISKGREALGKFENGKARPDDWNQVRFRVLVGKSICNLYDETDRSDDTLSFLEIVTGADKIVHAIAERYHASGNTILRTTAGELVALKNCFDCVDDFQRQLKVGEFHRVLTEAQKEANK